MDGGRWTVDGGRWTVDGGRWTVDGGRWTIDLDGGRWTVDGRRLTWTVDGGRWTVNGGRWTVDGGRWTVDGGRWTVDGGSQKRTPSAPVTAGNNTGCMTLESTSPFIKWNHSVHYTYHTYSYHKRQKSKPTAGINVKEPRFPCPLCSDIPFR